MTTLALADVTDTDSVLSFRPLVLGRTPGKYVRGPAAILRRVLYAWVLPSGVLLYDQDFGEGVTLLEGATLAPSQALGIRRRLEVAAGNEDYVSTASVTVELADGTLTITGAIQLVDGKTYPLEVAISAAGAALRNLGAT